MAERVHETERKYQADAGTVLPDLTAAAGIARVSGPVRADLDATYFDTADLRLARAKITLRRRTGGSDAGWHIKLPVGGDTREEVRFPLGRGNTKAPAEVADLVSAYTLGAPLEPVVRIATARSEWELLDEGGAVVAVVADDDVSTHLPEGGSERWREIEVEATDPAVLDAVQDVLGVPRSSASSKLVQALGERARPRPAATLPKSPKAGDVALLYLDAQVTELRARDVAVRLDTDDSVHGMRVAARRLRSALKAFRPLLDRGRVARLRAELKWLGGELAAARDTEVLDAALHEEVAALPDELVLGSVSANLTAEFARSAADARTATLAALDSDRHRELLTSLVDFIAQPPWSDRAGEPAKHELRRPVRKAWRTLERSVAAVDDATDRDAALHQVRKDAKKLRYAAEAVMPVFGPKLDRWRKAVKRAQKSLGAHQDAVVARAVLREIGVRAHLSGDNGFTYGVLHARQDARAHQAERDFTEDWRVLRRSPAPAWLR